MPQDLRLSTLTALAIDARHETILAEGRAELEQTRHRLQQDYPFAAGNVEPWGPGNGDTSTAEAIILTNHNFLPLFPR